MLRACPCCAVCCVAEVPVAAWCDEAVGFDADDGVASDAACVDEWYPLAAEFDVEPAVAALFVGSVVAGCSVFACHRWSRILVTLERCGFSLR